MSNSRNANRPVLSGVIGSARPRRRIRAAHEQLDVIRLEAAQLRFDQLVAALGDRHVAGFDGDAEHARRRRAAAPRRRDELHAVPERERPEQREQQAPRERHRRENPAVRAAARLRRSRVRRSPGARDRAPRASAARSSAGERIPPAGAPFRISTAVTTEALSERSCSSRYSATCSSRSLGRSGSTTYQITSAAMISSVSTRAVITTPSEYLNAFIAYAETANSAKAAAERDRRASQARSSAR